MNMQGRCLEKMNLLGEFKYNNTEFFIHLNDVNNTGTYTLVAAVHAEDRVRSLSGEESRYPVLRRREQQCTWCCA